MELGKRKEGIQRELFIFSDALCSSSNAFYVVLESVLCKYGFNKFVAGLCREFYADVRDCSGLPPGVYFRILRIGYMEGWGSEREIAWRRNDSLA